MLTSAVSAILGDRRQYLGASDVPAVAGLSPYRSALSVFLEKTGQIPSFEGNLATELGLYLEPFLAEKYEQRTGRKLETPPEIRHPEHGFLRAHLDRVVVGTGRVVELKMANARVAHRWGEDGSDEVPTEYLGQVMVQMELRRLNGEPVEEEADIAALIGNEFRVYTVPYEPDLGRGLLVLGARFWQRHVATGNAPALDASDAAAEWLARTYPRAIEGKPRESTPDADEWALKLRDAKKRKEQAEKDEATAKAHLQQIIGDSPGIVGEWGRAAWTNCKGRASVDWEAVAQEAGIPKDLIEKHTKRNPYRMFRPTFKGE